MRGDCFQRSNVSAPTSTLKSQAPKVVLDNADPGQEPWIWRWRPGVWTMLKVYTARYENKNLCWIGFLHLLVFNGVHKS